MVHTTHVQDIPLLHVITMTKVNEVLTAVILYAMASYILSLPNFTTGLLFAVLATQINLALPENYKHTLLSYLPLMVFSYTYAAITVPMMIGYTATIFINLLSKNGCKLLYPIRKTSFTGPKNYLENNTKKDQAATTFLAVLMIITLAFSLYGNEIMGSLDETNDITTYLDGHNQVAYNNRSSNYVQYINIDPSDAVNRNITTTSYNNTTTTIITEYKK